MWKGIAIGAGLVVLLIVALIKWLGGDPAETGAAAAAPTEWIVAFESDSAESHTGGWRRAEGSTCVWNSYEEGISKPYLQIPSIDGETWLVSEVPEEFRNDDGSLTDSMTVHLFFKNSGGEVEAYAGDGGRRSNDVFGRHVRVVPKFAAIPPAGRPSCETELPDTTTTGQPTP